MDPIGMLRTDCSDLLCTYLAHHEPEIIITMIFIVSIIIVITILGTFVVHVYINLCVHLHRGASQWVK